jgi:outer membrane protein TolC
MSHRSVLSILLLVIPCLGAPALAESRQKPAEQPSDTGAPVPTLHGRLDLSLADAIAMGVENNLNVEIQRHQPLIAEQDHRFAQGAYDPVASADFGYASTETPVASSLQESDLLVQRDTSGTSGMSGLIPWIGGSYQLGYEGQRLTSDSSIQNLSPQYTASVLARMTLPLMRGLFWSEPWTEVKRSRVRYEGSLERFRTELMNTVQDIETAYWNLVAREEDLRVAQKSLETAGALLEQTEAQFEVGVVSRVEVVEAEAGIADREFSLIGAQNRYRTAQDALIDVVLGPFLTPESRLKINPTDRPEQRTDYDPDEEQAAQLAFRYRPELEVSRKRIEENRITLQFAKNQRMPQLDLVGSYGYSGLAGGENPAPQLGAGGEPTGPLNIKRQYHHTDDDFFNSKGADQWSARAVFSIPLGNRQARARASRAEIELRRSRTELRRLEQDIVLEVRAAVRNLRSASEGIEAAERRRIAAAEQHRAETIRLEHGESTPFNVLEREEDLVEAESQKIFALQTYRDSVSALDRAQGTILRNNNIVVEDARALR